MLKVVGKLLAMYIRTSGCKRGLAEGIFISDCKRGLAEGIF